MHLTNYSVNKNNANFISNVDPDKDGVGSKWSLQALKKFFAMSKIPDEGIWRKTEDIIIKTILSIDPILNNAFEMYVPFRSNCFELLGFDIIIDDNLDPWLLETNLSPSLGCDSPLDQRIKGELIANIFNLIGVIPKDQRLYASEYGEKKGVHYNVYAPVSNEGKAALGMIGKKQKQKKLHQKEFDPSPSMAPKSENNILNKSLSKFQKIVIKESEDEYKR